MASEPLTFVLRSAREALNAQFLAARRTYPELDGQRFRAFLETTVDPVAVAIKSAVPDRVADVVLAAYKIGLELMGKRLIGGGALDAVIDEGWRTLATAAAPLLAASPRRALSAVSNALHQLATTPGARPAQWIHDLIALAPRCADLETLLATGQVLAWRAGLSQFRASALGAANALPAELALAAVGATSDWPSIRARLEADPWFVPAGAASPLREVGAFRGFGGLFMAPPRVALAGDAFIVSSGDDAWLLAADAFGATLHRATAEERAAVPRTTWPSDARLVENALVIRGQTLPLPIRGEVTSVAAGRTTLALTSSLTHTIVLIALTALP